MDPVTALWLVEFQFAECFHYLLNWSILLHLCKTHLINNQDKWCQICAGFLSQAVNPVKREYPAFQAVPPGVSSWTSLWICFC